MDKWRELAEQLEAHDNSDDSDNSPPNVTNVTNVMGLPPAVLKGLERLRVMPAPGVHKLEAWPQAVTDALALAESGWSSPDLFGAVTDREGYADADGLAAWLGGRKVLAICETFASVGDETGRAYFNRCNRLGDLLLWNIR